MRTISLNALSFIAFPCEKKFILLRSEKVDQDPDFLENEAIPKILNRAEANKIPGVWGMLGCREDCLNLMTFTAPQPWTGI